MARLSKNGITAFFKLSLRSSLSNPTNRSIFDNIESISLSLACVQETLDKHFETLNEYRIHACAWIRVLSSSVQLDKSALPRKPSVIFGNLRTFSEIVRKRSPGLRNNFGKSSEIFGKWSEIFRKIVKNVVITMFK